MNTYTFSELFKEYSDLIPRSMDAGKVLKFVYDEHNRCIELTVKFEETQTWAAVIDCQQKLEKALKINGFKINLLAVLFPDWYWLTWASMPRKPCRPRLPNKVFCGSSASSPPSC